MRMPGALRAARADALYVVSDRFTVGSLRKLVAFAADNRLSGFFRLVNECTTSAYSNPITTLSGSLARFTQILTRVRLSGTLTLITVSPSTVDTTTARFGVSNIPSNAAIRLDSTSSVLPARVPPFARAALNSTVVSACRGGREEPAGSAPSRRQWQGPRLRRRAQSSARGRLRQYTRNR